jgi:hypothetical protein
MEDSYTGFLSAEFSYGSAELSYDSAELSSENAEFSSEAAEFSYEAMVFTSMQIRRCFVGSLWRSIDRCMYRQIV